MLQNWLQTIYLSPKLREKWLYLLKLDLDPDIKCVIIPGEKSNSEWLIISDLYILHKNSIYKNDTSSWERIVDTGIYVSYYKLLNIFIDI